MGYPRDFILHRILQRQDIHFGTIELTQHCVQGRRLARSRRTTHNNNPSRNLHYPVELKESLIVKGQRPLPQFDINVALIEKPHRDMVSPVGPMAFIPDIDRPVVISDRKAP